MKKIKEKKRLTIDVVNEIVLVRLMFREDKPKDILVQRIIIPNKGINKSGSNIALISKKKNHNNIKNQKNRDIYFPVKGIK